MKDGPKKCYTKIPQSNVAFTSDMKKEGKRKSLI